VEKDSEILVVAFCVKKIACETKQQDRGRERGGGLGERIRAEGRRVNGKRRPNIIKRIAGEIHRD